MQDELHEGEWLEAHGVYEAQAELDEDIVYTWVRRDRMKHANVFTHASVELSAIPFSVFSMSKSTLKRMLHDHEKLPVNSFVFESIQFGDDDIRQRE